MPNTDDDAGLTTVITPTIVNEVVSIGVVSAGVVIGGDPVDPPEPLRAHGEGFGAGYE